MIYRCPYCKSEKERDGRRVMIICPGCQCSMIPKDELIKEVNNGGKSDARE